MAKQNLYEVLGVQHDASEHDLKKAYRRQAMKCHPDYNQGNREAEAKFKELNEAYDILKDAERRAAYDRRGHAAFEQGAAPGAGASGRPAGSPFSGGFKFTFEENYGRFEGTGGGRHQRRAPSRGGDLHARIEIGLEEALTGTKKTVRVPSSVSCRACNGNDACAAGGNPAVQACPTCRGAGTVQAQQGFLLIERTCPNCGGSGPIMDLCGICQGAGRVRRDRTLSVSIPAGVEDGTRIRLAGEGEAGLRGAPPGDLYVDIGIRPHPPSKRNGGNIAVHVPLRMTEMALDAPVEIPTADGGCAHVAVPAGSRTGNQFRLRGKNSPVLLVLLIGGSLVYAVAPSDELEGAADTPKPIAALVPAPVLSEAPEAHSAVATAPVAPPASGPTAVMATDPQPDEAAARPLVLSNLSAGPVSGHELPASAPTAGAPTKLVASPEQPFDIAQAGPSTTLPSLVLPPGATTEPPLFATLMRMGNAAMVRGDITGARSIYERAAGIHPTSSAAPISAGKTYDPNVLSLMEVSNAGLADTAKAREWYERARGLGDPAAVFLLTRLR